MPILSNSIVAESFFDTVTRELVDVAITGFLLVAATWLAVAMMKRHSASARHFVWTLAVWGLLLLPVCCVCLPEFKILPSRFTATFRIDQLDGAGMVVSNSSNSLRESSLTEGYLSAKHGARFSSSSEATDSGIDLLNGKPQSSSETTAMQLLAIPSVQVSLVWLIGFLVLTAVNAIAIRRLHVRARAMSPATGRLSTVAAHACSTLGLSSSTQILLGPPKSLPLTGGAIRPRIVLPAEAMDWSDERIHAVVRHEAAHILRHDYATQLASRLAASLYWFNPLLWLALGQMVKDREAACDDMVLHTGMRPSSYAKHLLHVVSASCMDVPYLATGVAMARQSAVEERIGQILHPKRNRKALSQFAKTMGIVFLLVAVGSLAVVEVGAETENADMGSESDRTVDKSTAVTSVEKIETPEQAALFLQPALRGVRRDSRALRESATARTAQRTADELLTHAIQWLEGKEEIKSTEGLPKDYQANEKTLLGVWRHRLNSDGTENLMIFGPQKTFVACRGNQVWVGTWQRRGDFLYTQNVRDSAESFTSTNLPDIQAIVEKNDGIIGLNSVTHKDHPGFTLTRIR